MNEDLTIYHNSRCSKSRQSVTPKGAALGRPPEHALDVL